jgi:hypothetical protein
MDPVFHFGWLVYTVAKLIGNIIKIYSVFVLFLENIIESNVN